jgi:hypothetical protein
VLGAFRIFDALRYLFLAARYFRFAAVIQWLPTKAAVVQWRVLRKPWDGLRARLKSLFPLRSVEAETARRPSEAYEFVSGRPTLAGRIGLKATRDKS